MNYAERIDRPIFHLVGNAADSLGREAYVVGGYVRDLLLGRHSKDIDFLTVGGGIELAREVAQRLGPKAQVHVYKNFGTAQVHSGDDELEFVGARRESYNRDSRKPIVEDGTLDDDISRRDFTINAMALSVNSTSFGELVDRFDGIGDLERRVIRTPLDPDITFSDDPLRMMRAIRFATQLDFTICPETFGAIARNAQRLEIVSRERIATELQKIMRSPRPSIGWELLLSTGLLKIIMPELDAMKGVEVVKGRGHKDNFEHTMIVLDRVAAASENEWLRWSALLHDIAKPVTKRWDDAVGWTFHNHNFIGAKMVERIFRRLRLPMNEHLKYVAKLVELHMRPIALVEDGVTDSAVRRLIRVSSSAMRMRGRVVMSVGSLRPVLRTVVVSVRRPAVRMEACGKGMRQSPSVCEGIGSVILKTVRPSSLSASMRPPWARQIARQMTRPSPVPPVRRLLACST